MARRLTFSADDVRRARGRALAPSLDRLRARCAHPGAVADDWARARISRFLESGSPDEDRCGRALAHGSAFVDKSRGDLERLDAATEGPVGAVYALHAELMLDAAIGMALVRETQQAIDGLLKSGRVEEAKSLSPFHHELRNTLFEVREGLERSERSRIGLEPSTEPPRPSASAAGRRREDGPTAPSGRSAPARPASGPPGEPTAGSAVLVANRRPRDGALRTTVLTGLLLALSALWVTAVVVPRRMQAAGPGAPGPDFARERVVREVELRHPSAFIRLDDEGWAALGAAEQLSLVDRLSTALAERDFNGALFTTGGGRARAQWLRNRGTRLLRQDETVRTASGGRRASRETLARPASAR